MNSRDNLISSSRITKPGTTDTLDHDRTDLPAAHTQQVIIAAPARLVSAVLYETAIHASTSLNDIIARERRYTRRLELGSDPQVWIPTGPVQAILLDPLLPDLTGDQLVARVQQILDETRPRPFLRDMGPLLLALIGTSGFIMFMLLGLIPLLIALPGAAVCTYSAMIPRRRAAYLRSPGHAVIPPRYPTITIGEALQLATLTPKLRQTHPTQPTTIPPAPSTQQVIDQTWDRPAERHLRIAEVLTAITELDAEWLEYQLDLHAWFLARPQLRNLHDPIIKAYREAEADLRDRADDLTDISTDEQITAAQEAARRALKAWGAANRHALQIGVTNLSPSEEAALGTLHGLVSQLNDRATPKTMWPQLITAISRTMTKLTTVPCTLADIGKLPVIESESRLPAIANSNAAVTQRR